MIPTTPRKIQLLVIWSAYENLINFSTNIMKDEIATDKNSNCKACEISYEGNAKNYETICEKTLFTD